MSAESAFAKTGEQTEVKDRSERRNEVILRFTTRANELCDNGIASSRSAEELIKQMRLIIKIYKKGLEEYREGFKGYKESLPEGEDGMERDNNFTRALREVGYRINGYETEQRQEHGNVSVPALEKPTSKTQRVFLQIMALTGVSRVSSQHFPPFLKRGGH